jgi:transposase
VDDWITIRELARVGLSVSEVARRTGHDRKTVRKVLEQEAPQRERVLTRPRPSKLDPYRDYLRGRIAQGCLNGSVLLDELRAQGYMGRLTILNDFLRPLRAEEHRTREATERFETAPGKQAQVDWASFGQIWDARAERRRKLYGFVFTLGYSRAHYLEFVTCCDMEHFLACHVHAFAALGIPEDLWYDNLKTGILGRAEGVPILPGRFLDFALYYGFSPKYCQPYRPRTKGKVERGIGYVRQNFWVRVGPAVAAGTLQLPELNERAGTWTAEVAHRRVHGTHGEVVQVRLDRELPLLSRLDARPRYDTSYQAIRRVGRDGRLSYRGQLYQLRLCHALTEVCVREALGGQVTIRSLEGAVLPAALVGDDPAGRRVGGEDVTARPARRELLAPLGAPAVELRDLAVYEEVARGAALPH